MLISCHVSVVMALSETLLRIRQPVAAVVLLPLALWATVLTHTFPTSNDQPFVDFGPLDVVQENCSGNAPFSEEAFRRCLPPPPTFTLPPPPPFISGDCGATYSWQLVRNSIAPTVDKDASDCSERIADPHEKLSTSTSAPPPPTKRPSKTRHAKHDDDADGEREKPIGTVKVKETGSAKEKDSRDEIEKPRKEKRNQKIPKVKTAKTTPDFLADVTTCTDDEKCNVSEKEDRKKGRKVRGLPGPPGPQGPPGLPGSKGIDGLPGLVVFPDAAAMFGVTLEGLIAYRKDVKQLFVRDHLTWRPIRVAKCGDGIVDRDVGEQCDDGNDDIHDDCLGCRRSSCGDGIRNRRTEECDGRDFGDKTCVNYRDGMTGPLTCTPECQISYQRCRHKRFLRR